MAVALYDTDTWTSKSSW